MWLKPKEICRIVYKKLFRNHRYGHPDDAATQKANKSTNMNVSVDHGDGYNQLLAHLLDR